MRANIKGILDRNKRSRISFFKIPRRRKEKDGRQATADSAVKVESHA